MTAREWLEHLQSGRRAERATAIEMAKRAVELEELRGAPDGFLLVPRVPGIDLDWLADPARPLEYYKNGEDEVLIFKIKKGGAPVLMHAIPEVEEGGRWIINERRNGERQPNGVSEKCSSERHDRAWKLIMRAYEHLSSILAVR